MLKKRSVTIAGHRTSIALEPEFWAVLDGLAGAENLSFSQLVIRIDRERGGQSLASALRLAALSAVHSGS